MAKLFSYSFLLSIIILFSNNAFAGAWLKKKGESELDFKYENKVLLNYYNNPVDNSTYLSKAFILDLYSLYYQYGINDKLTLVLEEKWFNYKAKIGAYEEDSESYNFYHENEMMLYDHFQKFENNPYITKIALQTSLWQNDSSIISIKPGFGLYNNTLDKTMELSLLYGYSFKLGAQYSYINLEYSIEQDIRDVKYFDSENVFSKFEATLGLAMTPKHTAIFKLLDDRGHDTKIGQFAWQYQYNQSVAWQTGYSTNLTNRNKYIVESIITSIVMKF